MLYTLISNVGFFFWYLIIYYIYQGSSYTIVLFAFFGFVKYERNNFMNLSVGILMWIIDWQLLRMVQWAIMQYGIMGERHKVKYAILLEYTWLSTTLHAPRIIVCP